MAGLVVPAIHVFDLFDSDFVRPDAPENSVRSGIG